MQQFDYFHGVKSGSDSRKGKANSSDCRSHSRTRRGNKRQSPPSSRDVPDAPPDTYRNVQDKLSDRYRTVQDKSMPDRYRGVQGKPPFDRYRNASDKSLPDSSKNAPDKSFSDTSRKVPDKSLPNSSSKVPDKSFSDSSRKVPDKSYPDSSRKVPDKSYPDSSRKVPDKSFPDSSRKVPDKSLPNSSKKVPDVSLPSSSRKMPDKSFPDSSKNELDKSFADSSRKLPDKSLPDSSRKVPDKPFISRYKNVPGNRAGNSQHSLSTSHSSHRVGQSQLGGSATSPVLRPPVIIPPVNMHPMPMAFMMRFPPPRFLQFTPGVRPYQTAGMTNDTFCDFDHYPSNLSQPPWENYQEMDESQFGFNPEFEPYPSSYSYWTNEAIEEPTTTASTSDANLTTDYSIAYSDAFDEEYAVGFYTDAPLGDCPAGHDATEFHEGYSENSPRTSFQAVRPQFPPPTTVMPVPLPVPHGIVSTNIQSFLPHFMLPKTTECQPEKHLHDASTNTPTSGTFTTASTNTESKTMLSVGTNTETAELTAVSTNTDQVETRTVATGTELSDVPKKEMKSVATNTELPTNESRMVTIKAALSAVMPTRETTDPSEIIQQSESGTSYGGAKPKRRPDSAIYTYGRSNEDETVDHSQDISTASSSGRVSSDLMSNPERSSGMCNVQKDDNKSEDNSCSGKLQSAVLERTSKTKRNLASKNDLDEVYYSDDSDETDELAKGRRVSSGISQPDDRRFSALNSPDFFPKWASLIGTASSSPLSPASTAFKMPPSPDLTKLPGSPTGSLNLPYSSNPLSGFSLLHKAENQKFVSATSSPCSIGSGLASAAPSLHSSLPLPPFIPESAGDASLVNTVLIENSALTRQIMMLLLKVNPLFALDPHAHRLAAFKELMLVRRCQFDMKLLQQRQKASESRSQHQTSWDNLQATQNNESSFGKTVINEQELSKSQLDHCEQQAGFNPANVPQRQQQNPHRLEGWPPEYLEKERPLQRQPQQQQHLHHGQHKMYTGCDDLQTTDESYLRHDNERITRVSRNHPSEEMEEKPFRQLRHQRRIVGARDGNSSWKDRFARQKDAGDWPQTTNTSEIQNDEHNSEKISELSEITVEDVSAKSAECPDEETWQKVCRKKKTVKPVKETGPKKFSRR